MDEGKFEGPVLKLVNILHKSVTCKKLLELKDGVILCEILSELNPNIFKISKLVRDSINSWPFCNSNIKKLLEFIENMMKELNLKYDPEFIDPSLIARSNDLGQLLKLIELVLLLLVSSNDKEKYIEVITSLDEEDQNSLMELINDAMNKFNILSPTNHDTDILQNKIQLQESEIEEMKNLILQFETTKSNLELEKENLRKTKEEIESNLKKELDKKTKENENFNNEIIRLKSEVSKYEEKLKNDSDVDDEIDKLDKTRQLKNANLEFFSIISISILDENKRKFSEEIKMQIYDLNKIIQEQQKEIEFLKLKLNNSKTNEDQLDSLNSSKFNFNQNTNLEQKTLIFNQIPTDLHENEKSNKHSSVNFNSIQNPNKIEEKLNSLNAKLLESLTALKNYPQILQSINGNIELFKKKKNNY